MSADGPETDDSQTLRSTVPEDHAGTRLDRYLAAVTPELSRSRLKALILEGQVSGPHGPMLDPGLKVKAGDVISLIVPPPQPAEPTGEAIPLAITYEDADVVVLDKPAGLVVHPAAGHHEGTLVNALIAHCGESLSGIGGVRRPGIVHRLDKDTSGLMVVAKSDAAHQSLSAQFASHGQDGRLTRAYLALAWGAMTRPRGVIDAPLARSAHNRTKIAVARGDGGRTAVTHYEVLESFADDAGKPLASLVRLELETGRTHQIRVHLAHIGHPVLGDPVYGTGFKTSAARLPAPARMALQRLGRQALHAAELGFAHPATDRPLRFSSPLPHDMQHLLSALRGNIAPDLPTGTGRTTRGRARR